MGIYVLMCLCLCMGEGIYVYICVFIRWSAYLSSCFFECIARSTHGLYVFMNVCANGYI